MNLARFPGKFGLVTLNKYIATGFFEFKNYF